MSNDRLVLGLLDNSSAMRDPMTAAQFRGFTISWSRYGYHHVILERDTIDAILAEARDGEARYCFILPYGHIVSERWTPEHGESHDLFTILQEWAAEHDFLVAGSITGDEDSGYGFAPDGLLVDLEKYGRLGCPHFDVAEDGPVELPSPEPLVRHGRIESLVPSPATRRQRPRMWGWNFIAASLRGGLPVVNLSDKLERGRTLNLEASCPERVEAIAPYLNEGIASFDREGDHPELSPDQVAFLRSVDAQTSNARRGVFLWNIESYADIEAPPRDFRGPVSSLYSVAAGFKPNRILQTHGLDQNTRVVYFDYSPRALDVKKCMVEAWDGEDFPEFVKYLFRKFPYPDTFYQLWDDRTPEDVDWRDIEAICDRELVRWGGARKLRDHWRLYRRLRHEYVCCNILSDPSPLLAKVASQKSAVIWWSNAFFTVYGNWFHSLDERKRVYDGWIEQLAKANSQLYLYGSDYNNINVNSIQVGEYWDRFRRFDGDNLVPCRLYETEVRM